jgi:hypothetical protein
MSLFITPSSRAGLATVHDLTVLVVANASRFLLVWSLTMAAFILYAVMQPPQYRYSSVIKLPEIIVKGQPKPLVDGASLVEYITNVIMPNAEYTSKQKSYIRGLKFTAAPGSNLVILAADAKENRIIGPLLDSLSLAALQYLQAEEVLKQKAIKQEILFLGQGDSLSGKPSTQIKRLASDKSSRLESKLETLKLNQLISTASFLHAKRAELESKLHSLSPAQIFSPAQRGQISLNLSVGVILILGFIFATFFGVISVIFGAFTEKVRLDVQRLKTDNSSAGV